MDKNIAKKRRKAKVRVKIFGTKKIPRLSVSVSISHIRAQIINDEEGKTICEANDFKLKGKKSKIERAGEIGAQIAEKAIKTGIKRVVFDRGAKLYHGRVKALADSARNKGLEF